MKQAIKAVIAAAVLANATVASATPSTVYWSPATTYVQPYLVPHLTYDTYFGEAGAYPINTGITIGVLPWEKLQGEVGFDLFYPGATSKAFMLNAKLVVPEGALGELAPGLSLGVQNLGFERNVNDLFLFHATVGKTFPVVGNVSVGAFYGLNNKLMVTSTGSTAQLGAMASWTSPDIDVKAIGSTRSWWSRTPCPGRPPWALAARDWPSTSRRPST